MKILFYFLILFVTGFCRGDGSENQYWRGSSLSGGYHYNDHHDVEDHDNYNSIIKPCSLHDLDCIQHVFAQNSQCLPVKSPAPDPYKFKLIPNLAIPHANLSVSLIDGKIKGLSDFKIKEFFVNKKTGILVLEVEFNKIEVTCRSAPLTYYRKGKEPIEMADSTFVEYNDLSFTLTVPCDQELQMSKAHVFTYVSDTAPKYSLGPGFYKSKDPEFNRAIAEMELKVNISLNELFATQGPAFFSIFFQNTICKYQHY